MPIKQRESIKSGLTHAWYLLNKIVASYGVTRIDVLE